MAYIKNIEQDTVLSLAGQVEAQPGQIVSRTLAQNRAVSVTLFAFAQGEEISTHDSIGDAMVTVLEGTGRFTVGGKEHFCVFLGAERFHVQPVNRHGVQHFRGEGPVGPAGVVLHQAAQRFAALVLFRDEPHGAGADDALEPG